MSTPSAKIFEPEKLEDADGTAASLRVGDGGALADGPVAEALDDAWRRAQLTRHVLFKTDTRSVNRRVYAVLAWFMLLMSESIRVLPVLVLLFLCSFLDRTNVGNAKIIGLADIFDSSIRVSEL